MTPGFIAGLGGGGQAGQRRPVDGLVIVGGQLLDAGDQVARVVVAAVLSEAGPVVVPEGAAAQVRRGLPFAVDREVNEDLGGAGRADVAVRRALRRIVDEAERVV